MFQVRTPVVLLAAALLIVIFQSLALADQNAGYVPVGSTPVDVAVSPDGSRVYSSNQGSNTVSAIDTSCNCVIATIAVGGGGLQGIAVSPDNTKVYVASSSSNTVRVISTGSLTETGSIALPGAMFPVDVAFDPYGSGRAYVTNTSSNNVSVINVASNSWLSNFAVSPGPRGIIVTNTLSGVRIYTANAAFGTDVVNVINPNNPGALQTIQMGANSAPWYLAATANGKKVYVSLNAVVQTKCISTSSNTVTATVNNFGGAPWGVATALTPFGEKVYVADRNGWDGINGDVTIIFASSSTISGQILLGSRPMGVAAKPDGTRVYVATSGRNRVSIIDTTQ